MERARVSAVADDLQLAEHSPEPSPEPRPSPRMLPPFRRPRRPAAPPPPPPESAPIAAPTPARRSLGDLLPRRSLLAPEVSRSSDEDYARGRDSDERKSGEEPESEKPRERHPRKKRHSRILSELRPVDGPESALPSVPAINDDDSTSDDPLEAPDSGERAKEAFAAQRVRMRKSWFPDLRIYMKNAHPLFGICAAHRHHPYKRGDRFLVLLVALLVALLLCGLFAIRDCCSEVQDVPVAVVYPRLELAAALNTRRLSTPAYLLGSEKHTRHLRGDMRSSAAATAATQAAENFRCLAFYAACEVASSVCAEGSTCRPNEANANETAAMQCIPNEMPSQKCVAGGEAACPTGWTCSDSTNLCVQSSSYVCYLPRKGSTEERTSIQLAKNSDGTYTAIEAIFQTLQIAANRHEAEMQRQNSSSASTSQDNTAQEAQSSTSPSTSAPSTTSPPGTSSPSRTLSPATSSPAMSSESSSRSRAGSDRLSQSSSLSRSSADLHGSSTSSLDSQAASSSTSTTGSEATQSSTLKMTLTKPVNGGVYSLTSTLLVEWQLALLSGLDPGINSFRVDFSADNGAFDTIATNASVLSKSVQGSTVTAFQFEWDLADNTSWLCTTCVLRICALQVESGNLCLRSDGQTDNNQSSRRLQTTTVENSGSGDGITFRIVREAFECSCGLSHESFLLAAVVIGLCIPVVVLLAEPLVTFYRDRQVFGLFARRDGPARPMIAGYSAKSATHKGRAVLVLVLLALCVASGFVAAQITTTNFLTEKGAIIILWVVTFAIAVALGVLVYCTLVCLVLFSVRWWRERAWERREPSSLSEYRSSLLSDDDKMSSGSITSPQ